MSSTMNLFAATLARSVGATVVADHEDASHAHLTPAALLRALDERLDLRGRQVTVAGDRLPRRTRERAEGAGAVVSHYYGAAELSFVACGVDEEHLRAFPGVELEVRSGEIWVRSPYLCRGYDDQAGAPAGVPAGAQAAPGPLRRDADGFATVGDRGTLVGGVLTVTGRGADAVVTGGATVLVADVEGALRPGLAGDVVVVGMPHPSLGRVVVAALTDPSDLPAAHRDAQEHLSPAQRPRRWFHVPVVPLTDAGKVDRDALGDEVTGPRAVRLVPRRTALVAP
jgi:acyl-CoA synthetase (AMP-forming)/AMP-acid ligase II